MLSAIIKLMSLKNDIDERVLSFKQKAFITGALLVLIIVSVLLYIYWPTIKLVLLCGIGYVFFIMAGKKRAQGKSFLLPIVMGLIVSTIVVINFYRDKDVIILISNAFNLLLLLLILFASKDTFDRIAIQLNLKTKTTSSMEETQQ